MKKMNAAARREMKNAQAERWRILETERNNPTPEPASPEPEIVDSAPGSDLESEPVDLSERITTFDSLETFIDESRPGFSAEKVAGDIQDIATYRSRIDADTRANAAARGLISESSPDLESAGVSAIGKFHEGVVAETLLSLIPEEYSAHIYRTTDYDDVFNGVDMICELKKDDKKLRFAVDATCDPHSISEKLKRTYFGEPKPKKSSSPESPEASPSDPSSRNFLGVGKIKYFRDHETGEASRLDIPRVVLGIPVGKLDAFRDNASSSPEEQKRARLDAREMLLFELNNQFQDLTPNLFVDLDQNSSDIRYDAKTEGSDFRRKSDTLWEAHDNADELSKIFFNLDKAHAASSDPAQKSAYTYARRWRYIGNNGAERVPFASLIVETSHEIYGEKMEREL
ncbi:hypothetical protein IJH89_02620, partial [Candidatus Saccharibacteria bacterium]|nr:hypothetical protein [Candidatus Saccharibacteria bacterium]